MKFIMYCCIVLLLLLLSDFDAAQFVCNGGAKGNNELPMPDTARNYHTSTGFGMETWKWDWDHHVMFSAPTNRPLSQFGRVRTSILADRKKTPYTYEDQQGEMYDAEKITYLVIAELGGDMFWMQYIETRFVEDGVTYVDPHSYTHYPRRYTDK